jgi:hypothetical protein
MTDSPGDVGGLFLQHHPHHDGCGGRKGIPDEKRLTRSFGRIGIGIQRPGRAYSPCKNVLRMIVPKIDFCRPANWYAFCLSVVRSEEVRS